MEYLYKIYPWPPSPPPPTCCFPHLSLCLTHIEMKGLLRDDGALLGSGPGPTSARLLFRSPRHYWFSCQPISGSISRSADVFLGAAEIDSRRDLERE